MCNNVCVCVCVCECNVCTEGQSYGALHLATCTYVQSDVFQFLFVDKGFIEERGYKECGREDFEDKYLAGEWCIKYNPNVMDVWLNFQSK